MENENEGPVTSCFAGHILSLSHSISACGQEAQENLRRDVEQDPLSTRVFKSVIVLPRRVLFSTGDHICMECGQKVPREPKKHCQREGG